MKLHFFKRKHHMITGLILGMICFSFLLTGCGNKAALDNYKANMTQFFENMKIYDSSINAIDVNSDTAVSELLTLLDSMDKSFAQMASLEVPEGFPGVDELADEASEYMTEAVSYYHQAFEGEEYNSSLADVAKQNYDRANLRIQYILSILHGDIPEEIYTYEDEADSSEETYTYEDETSENNTPSETTSEEVPVEE